jgi:hypothetical protein
LNVLSDIEVCKQDVIDIISTLNVDKAVEFCYYPYSYDNLKSFCGSERGVSLDELSFFINIFIVFQYTCSLPLAD